MLNHLKQHFGSRRTGGHGGLDIARHIGPGLLVTVGFIDPGNWASNMGITSRFYRWQYNIRQTIHSGFN